MITCAVCGKRFPRGNDPVDGLPNGMGLTFPETGDKVFNVCKFCISYRQSKVIEQADKFKQDNAV